MTTMPTPEEFMMLAVEPDEDVEPDGFAALTLIEVDPLFQRLERRVSDLERHVGLTDKVAAVEQVARVFDVPSDLLVGGDEPTAWSPADESVHALGAELDDLGAKYDVVVQLVGEIGGIVKKSTSKVSLDVKAAIDAWANPAIPETPSPAPDASTSESPDTADHVATVEASAGEGSTPGYLPMPAHDADVVDWYHYARALGHDEPGMENLNRSQIRTLLGIEQPAGA